MFLKAAEERLDGLYVYPMGLGFSLNGLGMTASGDEATLAPFLMASIGFDWRYGQVAYFPDIAYDTSFISGGAAGSDPLTVYATGFGVNEFGPIMNAEFFTFCFQARLEAFVTPRVALSVSAGYTLGSTSLDTEVFWHMIGLPAEIDIDLAGFTIKPRITAYF